MILLNIDKPMAGITDNKMMSAIGSFSFIEKKVHWLTNLHRFRDTIEDIDTVKEEKTVSEIMV